MLWGSIVVLVVGVGVFLDFIVWVILVGGVIISVVLVYILKEVEKNFIFKDYVYLEIDWCGVIFRCYC